jgi:hypothetical protein
MYMATSRWAGELPLFHAAGSGPGPCRKLGGTKWPWRRRRRGRGSGRSGTLPARRGSRYWAQETQGAPLPPLPAMPLHDFALGWGVCPPRLNALLMGGMHTRASSSQRPGFASPSPLTPVLSEAGLCLALSPHPSLIGGRALPRPLPSPQPYRRPGFASPSPLTPALSEAGLCLALSPHPSLIGGRALPRGRGVPPPRRLRGGPHRGQRCGCAYARQALQGSHGTEGAAAARIRIPGLNGPLQLCVQLCHTIQVGSHCDCYNYAPAAAAVAPRCPRAKLPGCPCARGTGPLNR